MSGVVRISRSQLREVTPRQVSQPNVMEDLGPDVQTTSARSARPTSSGSVTSARKERASRIANSTLAKKEGATTQKIRPSSAGGRRPASGKASSSRATYDGPVVKSGASTARSHSARSTSGKSYIFRAPKGRPASARSTGSAASGRGVFLTGVPGDVATNFVNATSPKSQKSAKPKSAKSTKEASDAVVDMPSSALTLDLLDQLPDPFEEDDGSGDSDWNEERLAQLSPSPSVQSLMTDLDTRLAEQERLQSARRSELDGYVDGLRTHRDTDGDALVEFPDDFNEIVDLMDKDQLMGQWADFIFKTPFIVDGQAQHADGSAVEPDDEGAREAREKQRQLRDGYKRMRKLDIMLADKQRKAKEVHEDVEALQAHAAELDALYPHRSRLRAKKEEKARASGAADDDDDFSRPPSSARSFASSRASSRQRAALKRSMSKQIGSQEATDFLTRNMELGRNARFFSLQEEDSERVDALLEQDDTDLLYIPDEYSTPVAESTAPSTARTRTSRTQAKSSTSHRSKARSSATAASSSGKAENGASPPPRQPAISRPGTGYVPDKTELDRLSSIDQKLQAFVPETEWESRSLMTGSRDYAVSLFAESLQSGVAGNMNRDTYLREARLKREAMNKLSNIEYQLQDMQVTPRNLTDDDLRRLIMEYHREEADNAPKGELDIPVVDADATAAAVARHEAAAEVEASKARRERIAARRAKSAKLRSEAENGTRGDTGQDAAGSSQDGGGEPRRATTAAGTSKPPLRPSSRQKSARGSTSGKQAERPQSERHSLYEWKPPPV